MKNIYIILSAVIITVNVFAQAPEKMSYQAVVRDASKNLVTSIAVGMQISVLQDSATGTPVYVETQTPTTNINGLVSIEVGSGTIVLGMFNTIDWSNGSYFIKTETDPTGGTTYTITGVSQLMSVPYALHANTTDSIVGGVNTYTAGTGIDITGNVISTTSACGLSIGDTHEGGVIFYLDASGCHGLVCASTDQNTGIPWSNGVDIWTTAFESCVGCGDGNTSMIVYIQGVGPNAVELCYNLSLGGYSDWYLPSKYELNLMYLNVGQGNALGLGNVGGFASNGYWCSTEHDDASAWSQSFVNGNQINDAKFFSYYVRAVRAF